MRTKCLLKTNKTGQRRYPENAPKESITSALNVHSLSFFKGAQASEPKGALAPIRSFANAKVLPFMPLIQIILQPNRVKKYFIAMNQMVR